MIDQVRVEDADLVGRIVVSIDCGDLRVVPSCCEPSEEVGASWRVEVLWSES